MNLRPHAAPALLLTLVLLALSGCAAPPRAAAGPEPDRSFLPLTQIGTELVAVDKNPEYGVGLLAVGQEAYVGSGTRTRATVGAHDLRTGQPRWNARPVCADGGVFDLGVTPTELLVVVSDNSRRTLCVLNRSDGAPLWQAPTGDTVIVFADSIVEAGGVRAPASYAVRDPCATPAGFVINRFAGPAS